MSNYLDNTGLTAVLVKVKSLLSQKANITSLPTKVSQLSNDSGYQTASDTSTAITNKLNELNQTGTTDTDSDTYVNGVTQASGKISVNTHSLKTKVNEYITALQTDGTVPTTDSVSTQIAEALKDVSTFDISVVSALPTSPSKGTIYLVPKGTYDTSTVTVGGSEDGIATASVTVTTEEQDAYDEYIWIRSERDGNTKEITYIYERIGSTDVDLTPYETTSDVVSRFAKLTATKTEHDTTDSDNQAYFVGSITQTDGVVQYDTYARPNVTDTAVDGEYVSSVSQTNGKITVNRKTLPTSGTVDEPIPNETIDAMFTEVFG